MTPEHKVMIYQSLLQETEDAAVALLTRLIERTPEDIRFFAEEFLREAGDGIDPRSKILRRSAQNLLAMRNLLT